MTDVKKTREQLLAQSRYNIDDLMQIVAVLRGEGGCPWDMEQTHESIRNDLIEETYEVIEAIDNDDVSLLREELGDLLFQIAFHTGIEQEKGSFVLEDIITDVSQKMIHRHPHVFGTVEVEGTNEVLSNWEKIKTEEKQRNSLAEKLRAIPPMLPALMRAQKVAKKCGKYDETDKNALLQLIRRQTEALANADDASDGIGVLLQTVTAYAQKCGVSAEQALFEQTNRLIDSVDI